MNCNKYVLYIGALLDRTKYFVTLRERWPSMLIRCQRAFVPIVFKKILDRDNGKNRRIWFGVVLSHNFRDDGIAMLQGVRHLDLVGGWPDES